MGQPTKRTRLAGAVACVLALASGSCISEHGAAPTGPGPGEACTIPISAVGPGKALVLISNFSFAPDTLRIAPGTQVTWVNCDSPDQHTSTSDGDVWSSPFLSEGDAYSRTFGSAGDFPYHCEPHPFMTGAVIVE